MLYYVLYFIQGSVKYDLPKNIPSINELYLEYRLYSTIIINNNNKNTLYTFRNIIKILLWVYRLKNKNIYIIIIYNCAIKLGSSE